MYAAKRNGGNRIALAAAVDGGNEGDQIDEIAFRPTGVKEPDELDVEALGL